LGTELATSKLRPRLREVARNKMGQNFQSVGKQYLLLPDPTRYLTDRLVSVNIPVPSINSVLQVSSQELLPALNEVFLLDTFGISTVPVAIRSFVHHFFPGKYFYLIVSSVPVAIRSFTHHFFQLTWMFLLSMPLSRILIGRLWQKRNLVIRDEHKISYQTSHPQIDEFGLTRCVWVVRG
jgi:hypothetical protein